MSKPSEARAFHAARPAGAAVRWVAADAAVTADFQAVLYEGDSDDLQALSRALVGRPGPIVPILARRADELAAGKAYPLEMLVREVSVCVNTTSRRRKRQPDDGWMKQDEEQSP